MDSVRTFLETRNGKITAGVLLGIACAVLLMSVRGNLGRSEAAAVASERTFIDAETLQSFTCDLQPGVKIPVRSPISGHDVGYPAEMCFWTKDGQVKDSPTFVLLNMYRGQSGPTFCPDCGRLVIGHNPRPMPGSKPPPTEQEYRARHEQQEEQ